MTPPATPSRVLLLQVGATLLGLDSRYVRQVVDVPGVTRLPRAAPALLGLIAVRGAAVPLLDLAVLLGLPSAQTERAVVLQNTDDTFAVAVSDVLGFGALSGADEESAPLNSRRLTDGRAIIVLDPEQAAQLLAARGVPISS